MKKPSTYIGTSGFYNPHWKIIFYPEDMPASKWLGFYCENFNTLEINATFYRFPTLKSMQTWYGKSPEGFQFSIKASKLITHIHQFVDCQQLIDDFYAVCKDGLKEKMGCILFQLPPSIHYSPEKLELIIKSLNPKFKNAIEFRHVSWWTQEVYDELKKYNVIFCTVNHPKLPTTLITTTKTAYVRLHGNPKMFYSNYNHDELKALSEALLKKKGVEEIYVFFNNTASPSGVVNALELQELIEFHP